MRSVDIPVVNHSVHPLPTYATPGSSGMDLRAAIKDQILLAPMQRILVPTGLRMEIPEGFEAQVRPRSGLAIKKGLTCLNTPGTIDADYRGEVQVILVNLSQENQVIEPGERIAQLVVQRVEKINWVEVDALGETSRKEGGFGHSGTH
jgi:dUTP pyrophosphatase